MYTQLLTDREVADQIGTSVGFVRARRFRGLEPRFVRLGRAIRYRPEDIERWVENGLSAGATRGADHDHA